jgi:hypothetical protein
MQNGLSAFRRIVNPRGVRLAILIPAVIYLVGVGCFIKDWHSLIGLPVDDGWIHRVYSRSFAFGHGFAYNDGEQEGGSTSPLWVIVSSPAHWFGGLGVKWVLIVLKLIGIMLGLVVLRAVGHIGTEVSGSRTVGCIAASLLAIEPRLLFSSLSGMEPNLLLALWAAGGAALLAGRPLLSVVLFSLAPLARPEAIVILPLALFGLVDLTRRRSRRVTAIPFWVIPFAPVLLWGAFCEATNGHFFPNTYYLKVHPFRLGPDELGVAWRGIFQNGLTRWFLYLPGLAVFLALCLRKISFRRASLMAVLVAGPLAYLAGVVGTRQVSLGGYYWTRWIDPASLMLMVPFCIGTGLLLALGARPQSITLVNRRACGGVKLLGVAAGVFGVAILAMSLPRYVDSFADRRSHLASDSRAITLLNVRAGQWIDEHTPADAVVVSTDAGAIRYFGKRYTIDLLGLNNAAIAFSKMSASEALDRADWLAVCPALFAGSPLQAQIASDFKPRTEIRISPQEYTVCNNPYQAVILILERVAPAAP